MKCPNCGYENRDSAQFCQQCGAELVPPSAAPTVVPDRHGTRPLAGASTEFAPLPVGALLDNGRYVVQEVLADDPSLNVYLVEETTAVRLCPNCRAQTSDPEEMFCAVCGADLSSAWPLHLRYRVRESADEHAFTVEARLLEIGVEHPGLLLPRQVFTEAPYGPPRQYRVESETLPMLATALPVPQPLGKVLEWGVSLAKAMDYLHRRLVAVNSVGLEHIAVDGKQARWVDLHRALVLPPGSEEAAADYFVQDVRDLAALLIFMATGQHQTIPPQLPAAAEMAFSQALAGPTGLSAARFAAALETAAQALRHPHGAAFLVGHRTDVGQVRSLNEDSLLTLDIAAVFRSVGVPVGVFAVADGMGGHAAGDVASRVAIQEIARRAVYEVLTAAADDEPLPEPGPWLSATVQSANRAVYDQRRAAGTDMGTTLVLAFIVGDLATVANIGDSRAYLLRPEGITQITVDHSLVQRLVATGQITAEEAAHHPQRNVIYRVIGDRPHVQPDLFEQRLAPGEGVLLCSDGLSGMVSDEQLWQIWRTSSSPQEACERMVAAANQAGGEDNVTVVIVQMAG